MTDGNTSAAKQASPVAKKTSPAKKVTPTVAKKAAPAKKATLTVAKKTAPAKKATPTAAKKTAPTVAKKTSPAKKATPTVAKKTAPANKPTPAAAKKTAPANKVQASARKAKAALGSKYFKRAQTKARKILNDPEKLQKIADESNRSAAARSGPFAEVMDDFRVLVRLVVAYSRGHYREIRPDSLVLVVAGLVYVVSPVDLIPDVIPVAGFMDDAVVIGFVIKSVRGELDAFRAWELGAAD